MITPTLSDVDSANAVLVFKETNTTIVSGGGQMIDLEAGRNIIEIIVTAGDDSTRLYTIAVTRLDQVVLNNVRLVSGTDCSSAPVATVRNGGSYSACVEMFPVDTSGMVFFTTMENGNPTTENLSVATAISDTIRTNAYPLNVTSSATYLMLTVTVGISTHEVRYPITDTEQTDTDNDGVPDTFESPGQMNSLTNLLLADGTGTTTTMLRQLTVPSGHRVVLGDDARERAILTSVYSAELAERNTTILDIIGISDQRFDYNGEGIYDFVVYLPTTADTTYIAIPLASTLTADRRYVKYENNGNGWNDFNLDPGDDYDDEYYSALGTIATINMNMNLNSPVRYLTRMTRTGCRATCRAS